MTLLGADLAQRFIDKTVSDLPYNVNIMNERGVIIASKDESRIGDFHEVAHGLLTGTMSNGVVREYERYAGTRPGINMFIDYKGSHVGVICVTGKPKTVRSFAGLVKASIEAMLEYELQRIAERRQLNRSADLLQHLLFQENFSSDVARRMAAELGISPTEFMLIAVVQAPPGSDTHKVLKILSNAEDDGHKDIAIRGRGNNFIVMKSLGEDRNRVFREYRCRLRSYADSTQRLITGGMATRHAKYFIGSIQREITALRASYEHARYLRLESTDSPDIVFFQDHVHAYFRRHIPSQIYDDIFDIYAKAFSPNERRTVRDTLSALAQTNYNIVRASEVLHVHRNTVATRLSKIKDTLNINPMERACDRELMNEFAYYLGVGR